MQPTAVRLGQKASRLALTPKHGNKDFYKGTRVAALPGGLRTGAPGTHVVRGKAKYRIIDEKVRVFVAPPLSILNNTPLRPYVQTHTNLKETEQERMFGKGAFEDGKFTGRHYLEVFKRTRAMARTNAPAIQAPVAPPA